MKLCVTIVLSVFAVISNAQSFKDDISVVQFSAPFTKSAEVSLKSFDDNKIYTFYIIPVSQILGKILTKNILFFFNRSYVKTIYPFCKIEYVLKSYEPREHENQLQMCTRVRFHHAIVTN